MNDRTDIIDTITHLVWFADHHDRSEGLITSMRMTTVWQTGPADLMGRASAAPASLRIEP